MGSVVIMLVGGASVNVHSGPGVKGKRMGKKGVKIGMNREC